FRAGRVQGVGHRADGSGGPMKEHSRFMGADHLLGSNLHVLPENETHVAPLRSDPSERTIRRQGQKKRDRVRASIAHLGWDLPNAFERRPDTARAAALLTLREALPRWEETERTREVGGFIPGLDYQAIRIAIDKTLETRGRKGRKAVKSDPAEQLARAIEAAA